MRSVLIFSLIVFISVLPACKGEKDDTYDGIGKIIAQRNKMRYEIAGESTDRKDNAKPSGQKSKAPSKSGDVREKVTPKKQLTTNALDAKKIVIVEKASGTPLGQGVAYVNEKGEIVKIKLAN